ncbi:MAG TPA: BlaI/MecI/CopY family transcriptional regulator [Allosphingosinicella sp.]
MITSVVNKGGRAVERIAEGEYAVMEVLWETAPLTAAEVAERVPTERGWSLATVKTMLSRLLGKGLLAHEQDGRRYLYRPAVARDAYVAAESGRLIDRMFGGRLTPLVAQLAASDRLSAEDIAEIEAILKELKS